MVSFSFLKTIQKKLDLFSLYLKQSLIEIMEDLEDWKEGMSRIVKISRKNKGNSCSRLHCSIIHREIP